MNLGKDRYEVMRAFWQLENIAKTVADAKKALFELRDKLDDPADVQQQVWYINELLSELGMDDILQDLEIEAEMKDAGVDVIPQARVYTHLNTDENYFSTDTFKEWAGEKL